MEAAASEMHVGRQVRTPWPVPVFTLGLGLFIVTRLVPPMGNVIGAELTSHAVFSQEHVRIIEAHGFLGCTGRLDLSAETLQGSASHAGPHTLLPGTSTRTKHRRLFDGAGWIERQERALPKRRWATRDGDACIDAESVCSNGDRLPKGT